MIAIIEDEVFGDPDPDNQLDILHILRLGFRERHYVQTEPLFEHDGTREVNRWFAGQSRSIHDAFEQVMESGFAIETTGFAPRPMQRIRVAMIESPDWDAAEPRLPVKVACRLLDTPLRLLVENARNDAAFVRACARPDLRERLERAETEGWVEFVNGGGLPEIRHRVRGDGRNPSLALRLWVLFDSDARVRFDPETQKPIDDAVPDKYGPSRMSRDVKRACERARGTIHAHQLGRRSIENYVPKRVLQAWAGRERQRERARKVDAFLGMTPEQQHYFNMKWSDKNKGGLGGDSRGDGIAPIYGDDLRKNKHLATGFAKLADFYHEKDFPIERAWFNDGQLDELDPVIHSIFERM